MPVYLLLAHLRKAVLAAVEAGKISRSRLESYIAMYNEVKDIREWQLSKTKNV